MMAGITEVIILLAVMASPVIFLAVVGGLVASVVRSLGVSRREAEDLRIHRMIRQHMVDTHPRKWEL